jgi:NADH:ubiquinone oxidoreductase subunit E
MEFKFDWEENKDNLQQLNDIIADKRGTKGALMSVLHKGQELFGYLPIEVQLIISEGLGVPLAEVYGVVTFYSQFTLVPKGKYQMGVCLGTACYVKGAQDIIDVIKRETGVEVEGTTEDGNYSLTATRCIGACGLAPVMTINDEVYGKLKSSEVKGILEQYK